MNFLKRSFYSLMHGKYKNIIIASVFSVIFFANVACMTILGNVQKSMEFFESNMKNSITVLKNPMFDTPLINWSIQTIPQLSDFDRLENSEFVEEVIYYGTEIDVDVENTQPYIPYISEETEGGISKGTIPLTYLQEDNYIVLSETQRSNAFTFMGYELVEGEHFKQGDGNVCLISEGFAKVNDIKVGDVLNFHVTHSDTKIDMKVSGTFEYSARRDGASYERDIKFISMDAYESYSNIDFYRSATVILKDINELDEYINALDEQYIVTNVYEEHFGNNELLIKDEIFAGKTEEELYKMEEGNVYINIYKNEQWYELTISPLEAQASVLNFLVIALSATSVLIIGILAVISVSAKKREYGILLSMGERKSKICLQSIIEFMTPLFIGIVIGVSVAMLAGTPITNFFSGIIHTATSSVQVSENELLISEYEKMSIHLTADSSSDYGQILNHYSTGIKVLPSIKSEMNLPQVISFAGLALLVSMLAIIIQVIKIAKLNPAQILMSRKE